MYHYRESGLDNIYLQNGYKEIETPYGKAVQIRDVEGLHRAIAIDLAKRTMSLSGKELRFIRKYMTYTQAEVGERLGYGEEAVRKWERMAKVPEWANLGIRFLFNEHLEATHPLSVVHEDLALLAKGGRRGPLQARRGRNKGWELAAQKAG